jgi:hypothetical protein
MSEWHPLLFQRCWRWVRLPALISVYYLWRVFSTKAAPYCIESRNHTRHGVLCPVNSMQHTGNRRCAVRCVWLAAAYIMYLTLISHTHSYAIHTCTPHTHTLSHTIHTWVPFIHIHSYTTLYAHKFSTSMRHTLATHTYTVIRNKTKLAMNFMQGLHA